MPGQYTLEDLHRMSWQEFEEIVVNVVRQLYSKYGITICKTPYSHDGGRDADGQHILAIGLAPDLAISIKVFLEIKKRGRENVGKSDIGSHLVDAFANKVTKVIFVTNREFTEPLAAWLDQFCGPFNIQYSLVSGQRLLEWLNAPIGTFPDTNAYGAWLTASAASACDQARTVHAQLTYTLDPNDAVGWSASCTVRSDRPVFALVDLRVGEQVAPFHSVADLVPKHAGATVHRVTGKDAPVIFSPGDRQRWIFAIWPERPGPWDNASFEVTLRNADVALTVEVTNSFHVPESGLAPILAGSQGATETTLRQKLNAWDINGGVALNVLLSSGGLGKSFIVGRLRREWQAQGVHEIVLDGEALGDDTKLVERTFSRLFPFPKDPFADTARPALERWLQAFNLSQQACKTLATDLCSGGIRPNRYSVSLRTQMFGALLTEASGPRGLVFVLEDLHKVAPSVLGMLAEGLSHLRASGRGKVFVLLTSRPANEIGTRDIVSDWLARIQEISALVEDAIHVISSLTKRDAQEILQHTAPSLEATHIRQIIDQVGTAPFNLREAILYLRQLDILQTLEPGGRPVLADPAKLNLLLEHKGLYETTRRRLEVFFRDRPRWLRWLVEAGACYGRQFPFLLVAEAVGAADRHEAMDAIGGCAQWSLLALSPDRRESLEFDHDLIRSSVLSLIPDLRRRELADKLLAALEDSDEPILLAALAYQAGRAQRAFDLARLAALQGSERGRPSDALRANHIALLTVDPDWAKFDKRSAYWVDLAVQAASPCRCSFVGWRQRDEVSLVILRDNLRSLGTVSAGSSALSDAILSEARMLSQRLGDHEGSASLIAMEGRLLFERDDVAGAKMLHENAERMFAAHGPERSTDRAENLVRLAICLRQMGRRDASLKTLRQALKHRLKTDWTLLNKVRSNMGAAYLLTDWSMVRYHWERQLRSARVHGLASREAHALASLSFINLFDGQQSDGRRQAEDAMQIAKSQGMDNTLLRCDLNLSIASLMDGNPDAALHFLSEAEAIAVQHQIGRRLWRVYANLATTHELLGDMEKARARDLQTVVSLKANTWEGGMLLQRGRALLPLINIAFRAIDTPELYTQVLDRLQMEVVFILSEVAGQLITGGPCSLNQILLKYLVDLRGARRFLLAE